MDCFLPCLQTEFPASPIPDEVLEDILKKHHIRNSELCADRARMMLWNRTRLHHCEESMGELGLCTHDPFAICPPALSSLLWTAKLIVWRHRCEPRGLKIRKQKTSGKILLCQHQWGTQHLLEGSNAGRQGGEGRKKQERKNRDRKQRREGKTFEQKKHSIGSRDHLLGKSSINICWTNRAKRAKLQLVL